MGWHYIPRYRLQRYLWAVISILLLVYFVYHFFHGDHGWLAWQKLQEHQQEAVIRLQNLEQDEQVLQRRVILLQDKTLDADMLEERAHAMLNYVQDNEIMIFDSPE